MEYVKCKYHWVTNFVSFIGHHSRMKEVPMEERLKESSRDGFDGMSLGVRQSQVPVSTLGLSYSVTLERPLVLCELTGGSKAMVTVLTTHGCWEGQMK